MRPATIAKRLRKAAEVVRRGWCRNVLATTKNGKECGPRHRNAARWCAAGAMCRAGLQEDGFDFSVIAEAMKAMEEATGSASVSDWNDKPWRTKSQVAAALRKAAKIVEDGK